jgi:hypothetical protein
MLGKGGPDHQRVFMDLDIPFERVSLGPLARRWSRPGGLRTRSRLLLLKSGDRQHGWQYPRRASV